MSRRKVPTSPEAPPKVKAKSRTQAAKSPKPPQPSANPIELVGFGISQDHARFALLEFRDHGHDGKTVEAMVPLSRLGVNSPELEALVNQGAPLASQSAKRDLVNRIQEALGKPHQLVPVATRLGWLLDTKAFVLPNLVIGAKQDQVRIHLDDGGRTERFDRYRSSGTLKGFRRMARLARGNSRFQLLLCDAVSGPVAALLGVEQVGLMLVGPPGSFKTTLLATAASVWGCHTDPNLATKLGFCQSLHGTINDLEDEALAVNHTLFPGDEVRLAGDDVEKRAQFLTGLAMRLETGTEKGRKTGTGRRRSTSVPFLLTSNESLGQLATIAKTPIDDAHHGRLIGIPLPNFGTTVFEQLHGFADAASLGQRLRDLRADHFGRASVEYLEMLVQGRQTDELRLLNRLRNWRAVYLKRARQIEAPGRQLDRVHERMATLYASGRFGIEIGLLPWQKKDLLRSLLDCTRGHIELVARDRVTPTGGAEAALKRLRRHLRDYSAMFIDLRKGMVPNTAKHDHNACPGYINDHPKRGLEYLLSDAKLEEIAEGSQEAADLKRHLAEHKMIAVDRTGSSPRYSVKRTIGRGGTPVQNRPQVVAIQAAAVV